MVEERLTVQVDADAEVEKAEARSLALEEK